MMNIFFFNLIPIKKVSRNNSDIFKFKNAFTGVLFVVVFYCV